jgi:hypothetical protein
MVYDSTVTAVDQNFIHYVLLIKSGGDAKDL